MPRIRFPLPILLPILLLCLAAPGAALAVPFWGARASASVDTPPSELKPGEWIWGGDSKALGPMAVVVSLTEQRAYAYRNGMLVGVSTISSGKQGHETPTGVFTILQKDKDHHSSLYNSAPMPYQQRLTWDGVALHAGGLPGYPESHGCVHLPTEFARLLFESSNMGMTVVVSEEGKAPIGVVHPSVLMPIDAATGAEVQVPPLSGDEQYRWQPERAPEGPLSMVLSRSDRQLVVFRDGTEIGRTRIVLRQPGAITGTRAYIVGSGLMPEDYPGMPGTRVPQWFAIGVPGHDDQARRAVDAGTVNQIVIPPDFVRQVLPLLAPGSVLVATDAPILAETASGARRTVLDSDPPGG